MNLINGELVSNEEAHTFLHRLNETMAAQLARPVLPREAVVAACAALADTIQVETHAPLLLAFGMDLQKAQSEVCEAKRQLSSAYLSERIRVELEDDQNRVFTPLGDENPVCVRTAPLGVVLHITAGNADALPVYSVLDGLLTENINLVKLPHDDNGLSIMLLMELMRLEPRITERVFVFDLPSSDLKSLGCLADAADGIVVWGGDEAVLAARSLAKPGIRLIEWGHKTSFAYLSGDSTDDSVLEALAQNICRTEQLLCNSCQGVYLDTDQEDDVLAFSKRFLGVLDRVSADYPRKDDLFVGAKRKIGLYTSELEHTDGSITVFQTGRAAVVACRSSELTPSLQFRVPWVKPLPCNQILKQLRPFRGHLQTCALDCDPASRVELERLFIRAGVVRVTKPLQMSRTYCGQPHDGEYSLRRLQKIISMES